MFTKIVSETLKSVLDVCINHMENFDKTEIDIVVNALKVYNKEERNRVAYNKKLTKFIAEQRKTNPKYARTKKNKKE